MKNLLFLLLFIPLVSVGQSSFSDGFQAGYKKGYCLEDYGCIPPIPSISPIPAPGFNTYSDGYARGVQKGNTARQSENSNNSKPVDNNGTNELQQSLQNNMNNLTKIALSPGFKEGLAKQGATGGLSYLGNGTYNLRYIWPPPFGSGKKSIKRAKKEIEKWIKNLRIKRKSFYKYEIVGEKGYNGGLGVYHMADVNFVIYNPDGTRTLNENQNIVKIRAEQIQKQKQSEEELKAKKNSATNEILKLKELLDLELITKEEFDKKAKELKKIILGN